ncbi:NlpC/P60 family protein [Ruicaihuangia caeni]|uniref:NlpC/P60 family protein n=1 Tax=Ruicaihuangia caeni TaxID=3042517 RepID=UPI00338FFE7E
MTVPQIAPASAGIGAIESRVSELRTLLDRVHSRGTPGPTESAFAGSLARALGANPSSAVGLAVDGAHGAGGGEAIVAAAKRYLGVPYVFGGEDRSGMDCSGLVQRVFADLGIDVPRLVRHQQHLGTEVSSLADAQPGDLIVTHNADHIVIYAGDGQIIHAPYAGRTVSLQPNYLTDADIKTIRRVTVPGAAPVQTAPAALPLVSGPATTADAAAAVASVLGAMPGAAGGSGFGAPVDGFASLMSASSPAGNAAAEAARLTSTLGAAPTPLMRDAGIAGGSLLGAAAAAAGTPTSGAPAPDAPAEAHATSAPRAAHATLAEQLGRPILALASRGAGEHTVTLSVQPEQLGPVTVRANIGTDGIRIELLAPDQGREALRGMLGDLRRELGMLHAGARLDLADASTSNGGGQGSAARDAGSAAGSLNGESRDAGTGEHGHASSGAPVDRAAAELAASDSALPVTEARPTALPVSLTGLGATIDLLT